MAEPIGMVFGTEVSDGLGSTTGSASDSQSESCGFDSRLRGVFHS